MILEIYITMQIIVFLLFIVSFYTRQEILWILTLAMSGILMISSSTIEIIGYSFDNVTTSYALSTQVFYYPYLMGINLLIFGLALLFGIFDIYDKFGSSISGRLK